MLKDENGISEYSFTPITNSADTVWCKASNDEDKDLCITMAQSIAKIQEICSTSDKSKKVIYPTWHRSVSPTGKESYNQRDNDLKSWFNKKTELLAKRSSKLHNHAAKQSPATVLAGLLQKYGDILEDINVNPNSRRVTPSVPALRQQNNVAESMLAWLDEIRATEDTPPLVCDKYYSKDYADYRAKKLQEIIDLATSISVAMIDLNAPKEHYKNLKLTETGMFETTS